MSRYDIPVHRAEPLNRDPTGERVILAMASAPPLLATFRSFLGRHHLAPPNVTLCLSKLLFHRTCPGCGLTRSFLALTRGEFHSSVAFNPLGVPLFFGLLLIALATAAMLSGDSPRWARAVRLFTALVLLSALVLRTGSFYLT